MVLCVVFTLCVCGSVLNNDDPFTVYDLQFYNNGDVLIVSLNGTHRSDKKSIDAATWVLTSFVIELWYII